MMTDKKGISPLIATVLIIGFTIVLAAVVMQWGGSFVKQLTEEQAESAEAQTKCIGMDFDVGVIDISDDITQAATGTAGKITFKVTSNMEKSIGDLVVQLVDDSEGSTVTLAHNDPTGVFSLSGYGVDTFDVTIEAGSDAITTSDQLRVIPKVTLNDESVVGCSADVANIVNIIA